MKTKFGIAYIEYLPGDDEDSDDIPVFGYMIEYADEDYVYIYSSGKPFKFETTNECINAIMALAENGIVDDASLDNLSDEQAKAICGIT